jgi:hypothetical protein
MSRSRCRGTRKTQLQLLAAATAINLKRLLTAQNARSHGQTATNGIHYAAATGLLNLLTRCLAEIARLTAAQSSTGS